jgi:type VI secretion system protein VasJ
LTSAPVIHDEPRAAIGSAPVSLEKPAGIDARATAEYEAISDEVRKLDTEGPNSVDWKLVADGALSFIAHQSKDILVASWLSFALFRCEGLAGLTTGLSVLNGIITVHWPYAFPPKQRERARVAALVWLSGRLVPTFTGQRFSDDDAGYVIAVSDLFDQIDRDVSDKLTKESLNLVDCLRAIRPHADQARRVLAVAAEKLADEAKRMAEEAERVSAGGAEPGDQVANAARESSRPGTPARAENRTAQRIPDMAGHSGDLESLATALWSVSRDLHRQNAGDAQSYLLGRMGSWLRIDDMPAAQGGKTMVVPPLELEAIEGAIGEGHLEDALIAAEDLVWTAPFCLDAHRITVEILEKMDRGFDAAKRTVTGVLIYLTTRYPKLLELSFADGRPFAGEEVRVLLGTGPGAGGPGANAPDAMANAINQARGLIGAGKAFDALDLLSQTQRRASSGRQKAHWHLAQAQFCIEFGYVAAAVPLLDHLDRIAEDKGLETWEPELACAIADLRIRALMHPDVQILLADERGRVALEAAKGRLARLDIAAAARVLRPQ